VSDPRLREAGDSALLLQLAPVIDFMCWIARAEYKYSDPTP